MAYTHKNVNGKRVPLTDAEIKELEARDVEWAKGAYDRAITNLRMERNRKLMESDWMANSDVTMDDKWKTYRQELRDLTKELDTEDKVNKVIWPTEPS